MAESFAYLQDPALLRNLTKREHDLIPHLVAGKSDKEIGRELSMSRQTVKHHLGCIYLALGVRGRTSAAVYAATGWLPPDARPVERRRTGRPALWDELEEES